MGGLSELDQMRYRILPNSEGGEMDVEIDEPQENSVQDWFKSLQSDANFEVTPQRSETDGRLVNFPTIFGRRPTLSETGIKFGGGKWRFSVKYHPEHWTGPGRQDKLKTETSPWFELSEETYGPLHDDYMRAEEDRRIRKARVRHAENGEGNGGASMDAFLKGMETAANMLKGTNSQNASEPNPMLMLFLQQMREDKKEERERAVKFEERLLAQQMENEKRMEQMRTENTRLMISLISAKNDRNDGFGNIAATYEKLGASMVSMLENTVKIQKVTNRITSAELEDDEMDETPETDVFDWKTILKTLAEKLIPNLGLLNALPSGMAKSEVNRRMEAEGPDVAAMLAEIRQNNASRLEGIRRGMEAFGEDTLRQALNVLNIPYTDAEIMDAKNSIEGSENA